MTRPWKVSMPGTSGTTGPSVPVAKTRWAGRSLTSMPLRTTVTSQRWCSASVGRGLSSELVQTVRSWMEA